VRAGAGIGAVESADERNSGAAQAPQ